MSVITSITEVFSAIGDWIVSFLNSLVSVFWTTTESGGGELTFFGYLSIAGLAISVFFLIMGVVQNFLHFRG